MQGFVRENPIADDRSDNAIRRFIMGPQIFNVIKSALMDPELEELPTDYQRGLDFRISKTQKGGYADYSTSKWARKETALTAEEAGSIESQGLYNLNDFLPKRPGEEELRVIKEMFEASVNGEQYDAERFGAYYRPAGMAAPAGSNSSAPASAPAPQATASPAPAPQPTAPPPFEADSVQESAPAASEPVEAPAAGGSQKAEDILAMIRSRQSQA